jgi:hypothetical protein
VRGARSEYYYSTAKAGSLLYPMNVYVLLDDQTPPVVYCVTTDPDVADQWPTLCGSHGVVEVEINDYTNVNLVLDELEGA